jgi:hypothetical protein
MLLIMAAILAGCHEFGPATVAQSRPNYNEVIQRTSLEQTFLNLIRVHDYQPTLFMDISEIDVALQFQRSINTSLNLPRARTLSGGTDFYTGHDDLVSGAVGYQESPTIRYVPVQGQALVAQVSTPIGIDSIAALLGSSWPVSAVFAMSVDRLTPIDSDYYEAYDAIISLYNDSALVIGATRTNSTTANSPNDTLVLYCVPEKIMGADRQVSDQQTRQVVKLWHKLWGIYEPSQPEGTSETDYRIELRAGPKVFVPAPASQSSSPSPSTNAAPTPLPQPQKTLASHRYQSMQVLTTRSALGILRELTRADLDWDLAVFVSTDAYEHDGLNGRSALKPMVKRFAREISSGTERDFYVFDSSPYTGEGKDDNPPISPDTDGLWHVPDSNLASEPKDDIHLVRSVVDGKACDEGIQDFYDRNNYIERSDRLRHFLIIVYQNRDDPPPRNAYVSAVMGDKLYYIDNDDIVSKNNFTLISQFMTIQSIPQGPPLTPTISVGSH